jgi:hypothetical protein
MDYVDDIWDEVLLIRSRSKEMKKIAGEISMKGREELETKAPDRRNDDLGFS